MASVMKCVVVGDRAVGKTSALISYTSNTFPTKYVHTVFDKYVVTKVIGGHTSILNLFDTGGHEPTDDITLLFYQNTDVFLVCFSVVIPSILDSVRQKWVPEIRRYCGLDAQYILVGTQIDLRDDNTINELLVKDNTRAVTREDGDRLARELFAVKYVECSALTGQGLSDVFDEAILAAIRATGYFLVPKTENQRQQQRHCLLCAII